MKCDWITLRVVHISFVFTNFHRLQCEGGGRVDKLKSRHSLACQSGLGIGLSAILVQYSMCNYSLDRQQLLGVTPSQRDYYAGFQTIKNADGNWLNTPIQPDPIQFNLRSAVFRFSLQLSLLHIIVDIRFGTWLEKSEEANLRQRNIYTSIMYDTVIWVRVYGWGVGCEARLIMTLTEVCTYILR